MTISNHLVELRRKHLVLDEDIERCSKRPSFCSLKLGEMKRGKLRLKEQIVAAEKLEQQEILASLADDETKVVPTSLTSAVSAPCDLPMAAE